MVGSYSSLDAGFEHFFFKLSITLLGISAAFSFNWINPSAVMSFSISFKVSSRDFTFFFNTVFCTLNDAHFFARSSLVFFISETEPGGRA